MKATFALGCFWEPDDFFARLRGVTKTRVGYMGGEVKNPSYQKVCGGSTGHAEAVEITFDPKIIPYRELLHHFWKLHDPTLVEKRQYSSIIFYHTPAQKREAEESKTEQQKKFGKKILTEILPVGIFYEAEAYHQKYLQKRGP
ncbi:peptide-methionine (S)-S-oxide reductase MsrA [Candidatus Woesearchaeota archaeon]|nr:peptide-methionine (S)-S-oxide reductase MsrA [Candidatus Woesearchaeota archaeon]